MRDQLPRRLTTLVPVLLFCHHGWLNQVSIKPGQVHNWCCAVCPAPTPATGISRRAHQGTPDA